jgi:hypothetical protein
MKAIRSVETSGNFQQKMQRHVPEARSPYESCEELSPGSWRTALDEEKHLVAKQKASDNKFYSRLLTPSLPSINANKHFNVNKKYNKIFVIRGGNNVETIRLVSDAIPTLNPAIVGLLNAGTMSQFLQNWNCGFGGINTAIVKTAYNIKISQRGDFRFAVCEEFLWKIYILVSHTWSSTGYQTFEAVYSWGHAYSKLHTAELYSAKLRKKWSQ